MQTSIPDQKSACGPAKTHDEFMRVLDIRYIMPQKKELVNFLIFLFHYDDTLIHS